MDKPQARHFALIFVIAFATLCFELLATRILAFVFWSHVVYLVISIALLGYGVSSTLLSLAARRIERIPEQTFLGANLLAFGASAIMALFLMVGLHVDITRVVGTAGAMRALQAAAPLLFAYGLCLLPFFFSGNVIIYLFTRYSRSANRLYLFDLVGAAGGCLGFVVLMGAVGAVRGVAICVLLGTLAGVAICIPRSEARARPLLLGLGVVLALVGSGLLMRGDQALSFRIDEAKVLSQALSPVNNPTARLEYSAWDVVTRFDVVTSDKPLRLGWTDLPSDRKLITFDGDAVSHMARRTAAFPTSEDFEKMKTSFQSLFFPQAAGGKALVIGLGGGPDLANALLLKASSITGVDINGSLIKAMKGRFAEFTGNLYNRPQIQIHHSDGRSYLARHHGNFDLITMSGVDTFTALSTGAYVMAENHLYTKEAIKDYVSSLSDRGALYVLRWYFPRQPRETLRLFTTIMTTLKDLGYKEPWRHVVVLWSMKDFKPALTIFRKKPYTEDEARALLAELPRLRNPNVLPIYLPLPPEEWLPKAGMGAQYFALASKALREGDQEAFYDLYPYDVEPTTDDAPFFFKYYKFSTLIKETWGAVRAADLIHGYFSFFVFIIVLAAATVAVGLFVWLPLVWFRRDGLQIEGSMRAAGYFASLGLGFIMLEISMMQRFSVFLQHPMYSIAAVMGSMLFFAGIGSLLCERWFENPMRGIQSAGVAVMFLVFIELLAGPSIREYFLGAPLGARIAIAIVSVAPLAVALGCFFPLGLFVVQGRATRFVPWAWAINSGFTVIGSVLAIVLAMVVGFGHVMMIAAATYGLGLLSFGRYVSTTKSEAPAPQGEGALSQPA